MKKLINYLFMFFIKKNYEFDLLTVTIVEILQHKNNIVIHNEKKIRIQTILFQPNTSITIKALDICQFLNIDMSKNIAIIENTIHNYYNKSL